MVYDYYAAEVNKGRPQNVIGNRSEVFAKRRKNPVGINTQPGFLKKKSDCGLPTKATI